MWSVPQGLIERGNKREICHGASIGSSAAKLTTSRQLPLVTTWVTTVEDGHDRGQAQIDASVTNDPDAREHSHPGDAIRHMTSPVVGLSV